MIDSYYLLFSVQVTASQPTTIAVGRATDSTTTITVTPTIGQSVVLQCRRIGIKQWYTTGSVVRPTPKEIRTRGGPIKILAFSSFTPSHAGTYTCLISSKGDTQTKTTYPVVLGESLCRRIGFEVRGGLILHIGHFKPKYGQFVL